MKFRGNKDFRSITPNEFITKGTLVWMERTMLRTGEPYIIGPYVLESDWSPDLFGPANQSTKTKSKVKLLSTIDGDVEFVSWRSFLFTTYFVMNEEKLCIDVETR